MITTYCSHCDTKVDDPFHHEMDILCRRCYLKAKYKGMTPFEYINSKGMRFTRSAIDNHLIVGRDEDLMLLVLLGETVWWDDANYPDVVHIEEK